MDSRRLRVVLVALSLALLVGQLVWFGFGTHTPAGGATRLSASTLHANYESYVDQRVAVTAPVVATDPVVVALGEGTDARLTVRDVEVRVSTGDRLKLYGVVEAGHEMRAIDAVAVPKCGLWYTYAVSLLAGVWVLLRIVCHWRLDVRTLALERRERPLWFWWGDA